MLALLAAVTALVAAPSPQFVVQADRTVGGVELGRSGVTDARSRFGAPTTLRVDKPYACVASWRRLRLTLLFVDLSGRRPCRDGILVRATIVGRASFRTSRGLRVHDSVDRLQELYPGATFRRSFAGMTGYWLVRRRACAEVGGNVYPGLLARAQRGRVSALVVTTAVCE